MVDVPRIVGYPEADRPATRDKKIKVTPEAIKAGAEIIAERWCDLMSDPGRELFAKVSAEILETARLALQTARS